MVTGVIGDINDGCVPFSFRVLLVPMSLLAPPDVFSCCDESKCAVNNVNTVTGQTCPLVWIFHHKNLKKFTVSAKTGHKTNSL